MSRLRFKQVDVFTERPFCGNPVAVILGADGLSGESMQRIAAWTNLSETTFVLTPTTAGAHYRLRIFTPRDELPFAGHPTIGSAHAVLEAGMAMPEGGVLRQECGAGLITLSTDAGGRLWARAPQPRVTRLDARYVPELEQALGAPVAGQPQVVHVGPTWLVADLGDAMRVDLLMPEMASIAKLSGALGLTGITVFGATGGGEAALHVRSFAPAHGVAEDPVCGSGNVSVAACLARTGLAARIGTEYVARQGMALGRDGRVAIRIGADGAIDFGGCAVTCVDGTLRAA